MGDGDWIRKEGVVACVGGGACVRETMLSGFRVGIYPSERRQKVAVLGSDLFRLVERFSLFRCRL